MNKSFAGLPGLIPDNEIYRLCTNPDSPMIEPFVSSSVSNGVISYGLSSYGYDVRLARKFKIFKDDLPKGQKPIDPKNFDHTVYTDHEGPYCIIPPHGFVLGTTVEYFKIPKDILVIALAKSTYARVSVVVGVTPIEPGMEGEITLELSNTSNIPVKVYADEGICQFLFFRGAGPCDVSYADRKGKYMGQRGVTLPKMKLP